MLMEKSLCYSRDPANNQLTFVEHKYLYKCSSYLLFATQGESRYGARTPEHRRRTTWPQYSFQDCEISMTGPLVN